MIPKIIHYCWFGRGEMPQLAKDCITTWHKYMPYWEYKLWNEDNFDINYNDYTREAYEAKKYAFVSDVARLVALKEFGGLYLDVDFEVCKPFDNLMGYKAFAGFEGSKHAPLMMGVCATAPQGEWVTEMLASYDNRHFILPDGSYDLTTNVQYISKRMAEGGFQQNGKEQDYKDLRIFPVDFFCPLHTTGEYIRTENTYCEHKGLNSWGEKPESWKYKMLNLFGINNRIRLIKFKRRIFG